MRRFVLLLLLSPCFLHLAAQQTVPYPKAEATLHANRVRVNGIFPGGVKPPSGTKPPFVIDFDGNTQPNAGIGGVGLWIAGLDTAGRVRAACRDDGSSQAFASGTYRGHWPSDSIANIHWDRIFSVTRSDLLTHRADWADNGVLDNPVAAIVGWPGKGNPHFIKLFGFAVPNKDMAPFVDVNQDGIYDPFDGDYPHPNGLDTDIVPGQIVWHVYNDTYGLFLQYAPLGVEIHATSWALYCDGDNLLNETAFFSYKIINRSGHTLDSVSVGTLIHRWLGSSFYPYSGTYVDGNSVFIYNFINIAGGFGINPPVASYTFLNHDLTKSMYMLYGPLCSPDPMRLGPSVANHYYQFLNGRWRNGWPLTFGGIGIDQNNPPTDFAFPDDPNGTGWSEWSIAASPWNGCLKMLPSVYFGTLPPDTSIVLETAYSYHRGPGLNHLQNVTYCYERIGQLQALYDNHFSGSCTYTPCTDDCVWPGDLDRDGIVRVRDILPLGVGWAATGEKRIEPVTWAPHHADDWGVAFDNKYDFKHIDGNGDGVIDSLDKLLVQAFLGYQTPAYSTPPDVYQTGEQLRLRHISPPQSPAYPHNVKPNQFANLYIRVIEPNLFGFAVDIDVDSNYWVVVEASPLTSVPFIEIKKYPLEAVAVFKNKSHSFVPQTNYFRLILRSKAIPDSLPDTTFVRLKNMRGIRADGSEVLLGSNELHYCFGGNCPTYVQTSEPKQEPVTVFPNPTNGLVTLLAPDLHWQRIEAFDLNGRCIRNWDEPGNDSVELDLSSMPKGWVLLRISGQNWVGVARILVGF